MGIGKYSSFGLSLLTIALTQAVYAAEEPQVMDEVVVSGSRTATKLSETPVAIGVVNDKALKRDKPKTIGDAINRISGVTWVDLGNEQHYMGIRQPNGSKALYQYLEDGIPIRPLGVFNHNTLNELNLAGAERVEVVKGAASSLYGSNAVGGAVNFTTARSSLTPYASVGVRNEHKNGYRRIDTGASNTWGDFGLRFAHYSSRRTANWQQYSRGEKDSATLRSDYALSGSSLIYATLSYNNLDSATPGGLGWADYQNNPGKSYQTFSWRKDKSTRLNIAWEGETLQNGLTTVTMFGRQNDHGQLPNYTIFRASCGVVGKPACLPGQVNGNYYGTLNNNHVSSLGLDVKHQQDFKWLSSRLIAGLYYDVSPNAYTSRNLDVTRNAVTQVYTGYTDNSAYVRGNRDYRTDIKNTALFAQWELSPMDKVRVVVGGRLDNINYDFVNNLTPGADFGAPSESRSFGRFSPKIGGTYTVNDQASMYVNVSEGFKPPEVSELYGKSAVPDLKPSVYNNYELGLRMAFFDNALKLDAALYRLDGRDTIESFSPAVGVSENRNAGRTRSGGLELSLNWDAGAIDARLGASVASHRYLQYKTSPTNDLSGKEMPSSPDTVTAEIGYKPVKDARVALELVQQSPYWIDNANTVRYSGHTLLNLRGSYKFAGGWEAWLQGRNLTNKLYADSVTTQSQYTTGAPRSLMIGLNYVFDGKK